MSACVCSVIDRRMTSHCGKNNKVAHEALAEIYTRVFFKRAKEFLPCRFHCTKKVISGTLIVSVIWPEKDLNLVSVVRYLCGKFKVSHNLLKLLIFWVVNLFFIL